MRYWNSNCWLKLEWCTCNFPISNLVWPVRPTDESVLSKFVYGSQHQFRFWLTIYGANQFIQLAEIVLLNLAWMLVPLVKCSNPKLTLPSSSRYINTWSLDIYFSLPFLIYTTPKNWKTTWTLNLIHTLTSLNYVSHLVQRLASKFPWKFFMQSYSWVILHFDSRMIFKTSM